MDMRIDACEPPRRLALSAEDEYGSWHIELALSETRRRDRAAVRAPPRPSTEGVGEFGPGWEYYLDMLVAARDGAPLPSFDDYYPAMKPYYDGLRADQP